jgi:carbonic anhydrase
VRTRTGSAPSRACALAGLAAAWILALGASHSAPTLPTADSVLAELKAGNSRHVKHAYTHPHLSAARRTELAKGQEPHAVILSCADSRVAPEIVFDKGLGDLFTIRVAGNIAGDAEIASMEYAVEHLHTPLIVVMGHQSCGAVKAAIDGGNAPGHLPTLILAIQPAVERVVDRLRSSHPILAEAVRAGKLRIVGAVYSLDSGAVTWLPGSPIVVDDTTPASH